tara:strand:+ start:1055 stop:1222 length:168 start_codon:yes stop_codon:yes gene_type:complete
MSKSVTIELGAELQREFEIYLECCKSLGVSPRINALLNFIHNYGTFDNPKEPEWE